MFNCCRTFILQLFSEQTLNSGDLHIVVINDNLKCKKMRIRTFRKKCVNLMNSCCICFIRARNDFAVMSAITTRGIHDRPNNIQFGSFHEIAVCF